MGSSSYLEVLDRCFGARSGLFDSAHQSACRLFNGFAEGLPDLAIDLYGATVVLTNYADPPGRAAGYIDSALELVRARLPWLHAGVLKIRSSADAVERRGTLLFGDEPDRKVREHGIWYAIDVRMHQDAGLYLDTRNLRRWALDHLKGKTVLNTFAYTGSLGVAALAGGAIRVIQLDRSSSFLDIAKSSYTLNGLPVEPRHFIRADFFQQAGRFKRQGLLFDCVFLDPPIFSTSPRGVVDQVHESARLINKVRPLVNHGGALVAVNNAVYVSGQQYMDTLQKLCADGYMEFVESVPVPPDFAGYPETRRGLPIADPAPFNHATKIAILKIFRKDNSHARPSTS